MNLSEKSLNQKIINYAKSVNAKDVNKVRTTIVLERLVARIRTSKILEGKLVFCGGFVLYKQGVTDRYTRDVDMISSDQNHDQVITEIKRVIELDLGDGFWFGDTKIEEVQNEVLYGGVRLKPLYKVGLPFPEKGEYKKLRRVHLDISFQSLNSQMFFESTIKTEINGYDEISWEIYSIEYIASDKVHAIISRAGLSTRSKDVYDLSYILKKCDPEKLKLAINYTFEIRGEKLVKTISETFLDLDIRSLRDNWKKIDFKENSKTFDNCWGVMIEYFKEYDV